MPSITQGPWAGTMVDCEQGFDATVTQAKLTKVRREVKEIVA